MDNSPLAYFLTFTTYGTWLHGRDPGSVDRRHNRFDTPFLPADPGRERTARSRMRQPNYLLDEAQRGCVLDALRDVAAHRGWTLWAAHVRTNHVHVVIAAPGVRPEKVLVDLKAWSSRRLREAFGEDADRDRWTQHGSTRYLWGESELETAMDYVIRRQGEPMAVFPESVRAGSVSDGVPAGLQCGTVVTAFADEPIGETAADASDAEAIEETVADASGSGRTEDAP